MIWIFGKYNFIISLFLYQIALSKKIRFCEFVFLNYNFLDQYNQFHYNYLQMFFQNF